MSTELTTTAWQLVRPPDRGGWWSFRKVLGRLPQKGSRQVVGWYLLATVLSIATGIACVAFGWSGIHLFQLGPTPITITIYPPLLIGMLLFLWLGPSWALWNTFIAALVLALYSGMSVVHSLIFATADPVLILLVWGGLSVLEVPALINRAADWAFFLALTLAGCVASSLGALVWNYSHSLDATTSLAVWEGWVIGAFLQAGLLAVPLHHFLGARVRERVDRTLKLEPKETLGPSGGSVLLFAALALLTAISMVVVQLFVRSLNQVTAEVFAQRMPELTLFAVLVFVSFVGTIVLFVFALTRRSEIERRRARRDSLTGARNRLAFASIFDREAARVQRLGHPLSLMFTDIDRFKTVNDEHGHLVGDRVLRAVAETLRSSIRTTDYLFRWGGEEFVILLPHTQLRDAALLAERVRTDVIAAGKIAPEGEEPIAVTVSTGVASYDGTTGSLEGLLEVAANACRESKSAGRNTVTTFPRLSSE